MTTTRVLPPVPTVTGRRYATSYLQRQIHHAGCVLLPEHSGTCLPVPAHLQRSAR